MTIERRRFVELPGTTKLLAFDADKQDEDSSNLDPVSNFEGVSELLRSTSSARSYAKTNTLAEGAYTRLRYALSVGYLALGKRFRAATLARCLATCTARAVHALFQLLQADAAHANERSGGGIGELLKGRLPLESLRFSVATPLRLTSGWTGFEGLRKMWAFQAAVLELGQPILLAMHVGRIWDCTGPIIALMTAAIGRLRRMASVPERMIGTIRCCSLKRARCCMLHEIFAGLACPFNALADEDSTPPRSRRLLGSRSEKLRSTPETALPNRRNRTPDASNRGDIWLLSNRWRQLQEYVRLLPLCVSRAVGSPDTAVATVWRS